MSKQCCQQTIKSGYNPMKSSIFSLQPSLSKLAKEETHVKSVNTLKCVVVDTHVML